MHPIEHLRYLARARGIDGESLVREAAVAIGSLPDDPAMLVVVCRRLIEQHPTVASLWWLCGEVLVADRPTATAWDLYERHELDDPYRVVATEVPDGGRVAVAAWSEVGRTLTVDRPDVQLVDIDVVAARSARSNAADGSGTITIIEPVAVSSSRVLVPADVQRAMASFDAPARSVWAICRLGVRVHDRVLDEIERLGDGRFIAAPSGAVGHIVDHDGLGAATAANLRPDGAFAPELLRGLP